MNIKNLYNQYSLNTYTRVGPVFVKGKGSYLWDNRGRKFLDLFHGWGVSILGHSHPKISKVLCLQAKKLIHMPNNLYQKEQVILAKEIVDNSFPSKVFFANSGAEAVEGAIKLSRLYGGGRRYEIITMKDSFHGRTFGALSATGQKKYKDSFKPLLKGFKEAEFGSFLNFKKKVTTKTVAVIMELVQGEGGVNVASFEYLKQVKDYCRRHNLLFIADEVQTGMGRTGKLFCYENYGIIPDIMLLSKGLGAGFPISAIVVNKRISGIIKPGMHASTFGGSPLAARVSYEVFKVIKEEDILGNVREKERFLKKRLDELKERFPLIKKVKGLGLMAGLELSIDSYPVFMECLKNKLVINSTHKNVLRIMPALNVSFNELGKGLAILEKVFLKFN